MVDSQHKNIFDSEDMLGEAPRNFRHQLLSTPNYAGETDFGQGIAFELGARLSGPFIGNPFLVPDS